MPEGHRQHKISYSSPLMRKFWTTYLSHSVLELDSLRDLTPKHDESGLPTTREGMLYPVLLSKFPESFLQRLINSKQRTKRAAAVKSKVNQELAEDDKIVKSWPQVLDSGFLMMRILVLHAYCLQSSAFYSNSFRQSAPFLHLAASSPRLFLMRSSHVDLEPFLNKIFLPII
jgi:hypothetical protein